MVDLRDALMVVQMALWKAGKKAELMVASKALQMADHWVEQMAEMMVALRAD